MTSSLLSSQASVAGKIHQTSKIALKLRKRRRWCCQGKMQRLCHQGDLGQHTESHQLCDQVNLTALCCISLLCKKRTTLPCSWGSSRATLLFAQVEMGAPEITVIWLVYILHMPLSLNTQKADSWEELQTEVGEINSGKTIKQHPVDSP